MSTTKKGKIGKILLSILLAVIVFWTGALVGAFAFGGSDRKISWIMERIEKNYYEEVDPESVYSLIGKEVLDPYSDYYDPEAFAELSANRAGSRSGFGFSYYNSGSVVLFSVTGNSPAERAGLKPGMTVRAVSDDGAAYTPVTAENFGTVLDSYPDGTTVFFDTDCGVFSCVRAEYTESYVVYRSDKGGYRFTGENALELERTEDSLPLPSDTAYIRLSGFYGNAGEEIKLALGKMKEEGKQNLILDLRSNGGGLLSVCQTIASYFLKDAEESRPLVVTAKYKTGRQDRYYADGNYYDDYFSEQSKLFLLADENTASASECLIGAMMDYGTLTYDRIYLSERNGVAKTYGKGIMQETFLYTDGSAIKLTTATVHWPVTDSSIHGVGVVPADGAIPVPVPFMVDVADTGLQAMLSLIRERLA